MSERNRKREQARERANWRRRNKKRLDQLPPSEPAARISRERDRWQRPHWLTACELDSCDTPCAVEVNGHRFCRAHYRRWASSEEGRAYRRARIERLACQ